MQRFARSSAICLVLLSAMACNKAKLSGDTKSRETKPTTTQNAEQIPATTPTNNTNAIDSTNATIPKKNITLQVTTPVDSVKAGGDKVQATATIKDSSDVPSVTWSVKVPDGYSDAGSIDSNGLYTPPSSVAKETPVTITATLKTDPSVSASKTITVIPKDQIFSRCDGKTANFPIFAKVYSVPANTAHIPNYSNPAEATYVTKVCMENYAVEPRNFSAGFPDVPNLFEWFSLQTSTTLIVPQDGSYTFELNSDDGARLSIDGKEIIDNDGQHQAFGSDPQDSQTTGKKEVTVTLSKGDHALALNYFQGPRYRIALTLRWKTPTNSSYTYVPRTSFK